MKPPESTRRERILESAARLFAEHGFHSVTIADIGTSVGISGPAVYKHVTGKDQILGEVLVQISQQLLDGARLRGERCAEPGELLEALIDFHVEFAVTQPELIIVQFREFANLTGSDRRTVRRLQRTYVDYWVAVLLKLQTDLTIPEAGAMVVAGFGLMNSTPYGAARLGPDELRPLLVRLARKVLVTAD